MHLVAKILPYLEIVLSILLVVAILLQQTSAGLGGAFGGGDDTFHHTRRGFEKFLFYLSIVCGILFALSAILAIVAKARGW
jgi:protein translocase SecG subunit